MNYKVKFYLSVVFFFCIAFGFSQDLIIQKNGEKIYCKIVDQDSVSIFYSKSPQKTRFEIKRSEVESYYFSNKLATSKPVIENSPAFILRKEIFLINITGGIANPVGAFASKDYNSATSGLANPGGIFQASFILKLAKFIGLSASYRYQSNGFDAQTVNSQYMASYPGIAFTTQTTSWKSKGVYGGLFFTFANREIPKLSIDFDVSAGVPKFVFPEVITQGNYRGQVSTVTQHSSTERSFAMNGGAGIRYKLTSNVGLHFNFNFFYGKPSFPNLLATNSIGQAAYGSYTQKITTLNIQAGLSFMLTN